MGIHEGAHAHAAYRLGDSTADALGKRTIDPFKHVNWTEFSSVFFSVIMPVITAFRGFPMGMAWVPVRPAAFRRPVRDHALVSAAGPLSNLALSLALLVPHYAISPFISDGSPLELVDMLLRAIYITSVIYGLFNLIPIPPLDGSRILYALLPATWQDVMDDIEPYGFLILVGLFWFGSAGRILDWPLRFFGLLWEPRAFGFVTAP